MTIVDGGVRGCDQNYTGGGVRSNGNRFQYGAGNETTGGLVTSITQVPATLLDTTGFAQLTVRVSRYFNDADCELTLRSYLVRRAGPEGEAPEE